MLLPACTLACATLLAMRGTPTAASDPHATVRGMTMSCQTWGGEWGSDAMVESMRALRDLGVNWISIHPYAGIAADGTIAPYAARDGSTRWLERPIAEAHALGLKVMVIPHLAYWGSPFSWKGAVAFRSDDEWSRFFAGYGAWIADLATACADADAFCVGCELDQTLGHERAWRDVIAVVRDRTDAVLTYAANWTDYERVPFWDALDAVGVQAYFPLVAHDAAPSRADLDAGWARVVGELEAFARLANRRIVFTELGYDRTPAAAVRPWESGRRSRRAGAAETATADGEAIQVACLDAALEAVAGSDAIAGAFLWKWFPGELAGEQVGAEPRRRGDFRMSAAGPVGVIRRHWGDGHRAVPSSQ